MSNQNDPQLRGFMKGVLNAEAEEAAAGTDIPDIALDKQRAAAMVNKYGAPRRRPRPVWIATAGLAAAAVVGLVVLGRQLVTPTETEFAYTLKTKGNGDVMGPERAGEVVHLSKGGSLTLTLQPKHNVEPGVQLKVWMRSAGSCAVWPVKFDPQPSGAFLLHQSVASLPLPQSGKLDLLFAVSQEQILSDAEICKLNQPKQRCGEHCQFLRQQLEVDEP